MNPAAPRPAVSIITPAYNTELLLEETIESVRSQTFADWEMVIVDDGSTDGTRRTALAAAERDQRIRVVAISNQGQAAARNIGIRTARAPLLALLDSDDRWLPDFLVEQLAVLDRHPDIAVVSANVTEMGGAADGRTFWPRTSGLRRLAPTELVLQEDAVCIMSVFRREVFDAIGGFDPRFTGNEDYEFWLRSSLAGFVVAQHFKPLGLYRRRPGSSSSDERRMLRGAIRLLRNAARISAGRNEVVAAIDRQVGHYRRRLVAANVRELLRRWRLLPLARGLGVHRLFHGASRSGAAWQS